MCLIFRCEYLLFRLSYKHAHSHTYINTLFCSLVHSFIFMFVCLLVHSFGCSFYIVCVCVSVCVCVFFVQWIYMLHYFICCCCCFLLALKHFLFCHLRAIFGRFTSVPIPNWIRILNKKETQNVSITFFCALLQLCTPCIFVYKYHKFSWLFAISICACHANHLNSISFSNKHKHIILFIHHSPSSVGLCKYNIRTSARIRILWSLLIFIFTSIICLIFVDFVSSYDDHSLWKKFTYPFGSLSLSFFGSTYILFRSHANTIHFSFPAHKQITAADSVESKMNPFYVVKRENENIPFSWLGLQ